jgi:hypothetical protein
MKKLIEKLIEEDEEMTPLRLSSFWLKENLFEYFIV